MSVFHVTGLHEDGSRVDYCLCSRCVKAIRDFVSDVKKKRARGCSCERCGVTDEEA